MDSAEEGFNPESTYNGLSKTKSDFNFRPVDSFSEMTNPAGSSASGEVLCFCPFSPSLLY